jgi:transposase InsO family protein
LTLIKAVNIKWDYQKVLKEHGITQGMPRKANSLDSVMMENWFNLMKTEYFYKSALKMEKPLRKSSKSTLTTIIKIQLNNN